MTEDDSTFSIQPLAAPTFPQQPPHHPRVGTVQIALVHDLLERRYEPWQPYYIDADRLIAVLTTTTLQQHNKKKKKKKGHNTPRHHPASVSVSLSSRTDKFVSLLDDEVDKCVVFFLDQQGQIARDLWAMWNTQQQQQLQARDANDSTTTDPAQQLYSHAVRLLRLVKFVDLNHRLVERLLSLHDELMVRQNAAAAVPTTTTMTSALTLYASQPRWYSSNKRLGSRQQRQGHSSKDVALQTMPSSTTAAPKPIQARYLNGSIGREAHTPPDHHRLPTLLKPDSLRATVGIAATVYYRYIRQQHKLQHKRNMNQTRHILMQDDDNDHQQNNNELVESLRAVPSMQSLASYLAVTTATATTEEDDDENDNNDHFEDEEEGAGGFDSDDNDDEDEDDMLNKLGDLRSLVLSERVLSQPVASSVQSLNTTEAKLVGGVLLRIDTAMVRLWCQTNSVMDYLACVPDDQDDDDDDESPPQSFFGVRSSADNLKGLNEILHEHQKTVGDGGVLGGGRGRMERRRLYSSRLNLLNSFLYMVSYYLVAPTSSAYAKRLGLNESMSGTIVGMTAVAALASTVLFSWWTNHSYKAALIFSSACCLVGNVLYAAGLPLDSLTLVLVGRLLNGFGSARAINRRYIADAFGKAERTAASAHFVASGAAGMSVGPGLAAVMPWLIPHHNQSTSLPNLWWQEENAAGWVMAGLWALYLVVLIPYFDDPPKPQQPQQSITTATTTTTPKVVNGSGTTESSLQSMFHQQPRGETQPLLSSSTPNNTTTTPRKKKVLKPQETPLWERPAALVTIYLVFLLKLVLELVLSAAAPITALYFDWTPSLTGWFLAALGLLVLPAIGLVSYLSHTWLYQDRTLILGSVVGTLVGCLVMLPVSSSSYTSAQYMVGTIILFIFPNTMEAPSMSLLSKNIPSSLSRGLFNLGFFTTEAGFSGRVVADSFLTWCGQVFPADQLVSVVFGCLAVLNLATLALVYAHMPVLVDPSKKYE